MLEDRILQLGTGYTHHWYISAAQALLRLTLSSEATALESEQAVDRVARQYYRVMASQVDIELAKENIITLPDNRVRRFHYSEDSSDYSQENARCNQSKGPNHLTDNLESPFGGPHELDVSTFPSAYNPTNYFSQFLSKTWRISLVIQRFGYLIVSIPWGYSYDTSSFVLPITRDHLIANFHVSTTL